MERFEIALSMDDEQLLIPSMLPQERPGMDLHRMQRMWSKQKSAGHETAGSSGRLDDILKPQGVEVESVDCVRRQYQVSGFATITKFPSFYISQNENYLGL